MLDRVGALDGPVDVVGDAVRTEVGHVLVGSSAGCRIAPHARDRPRWTGWPLVSGAAIVQRPTGEGAGMASRDTRTWPGIRGADRRLAARGAA